MEHTRAQSEPPEPFEEDLRALFRRTAPEITPTNVEALFVRAKSNRLDSERVLNRKRTIMIRLAIGTLVTAATGTILVLLVPRPSNAGIELSEVQRHVTDTKTVTLKDVQFLNGKPHDSSRLLILGPGLVRTETDDSYAVIDFPGRKAIMVSAKEKRATILEGAAFQLPERMNFYLFFKDIARNPSTPLSEREVDGHPAVGFVVKVNGQESSVWVDTRSRLPIRVESTSREGEDVLVDVMSEIVFDRPLNESLFQMTPPDGYKVETFGVPTLAPETGDRSVAAPVVTPLVGLGPARFGMTEDAVIGALGKPDRKTTQGTLKILSYYSRGFELWILPQGRPRQGLYSAVCLGQHGFAVKLREFQGKTDKGVGLGADRSDIIKAYGAPETERTSRLKVGVRKEQAKPETPTGQAEMVYDKLGLSFALFNGRVYRISIVAPRPESIDRK